MSMVSTITHNTCLLITGWKLISGILQFSWWMTATATHRRFFFFPPQRGGLAHRFGQQQGGDPPEDWHHWSETWQTWQDQTLCSV